MTSIAIIGSKGIPACYGGFETFAENLVKHLAHKLEITVYCSGPAYKTHPPSFMGAKLEYIPFQANGAQSVLYDVLSMLRARRHANIILILGVPGCAFLPLLKIFSNTKFIVHMDGIEWRRPKWGWVARNFLHFSEWMAAKYADCLIADNTGIRDYILDSYSQDSILIEYGGDHAHYITPEIDSAPVAATSPDSSAPQPELDNLQITFASYAYSVCRIEPENNIHIILEAFTKSARLPLVIVGNWSFSEYGKSLRKQYGDFNNLLLLDPIYDPAKLYALRSNGALYVHGHSAGGTNPSLVEAMYLGLPVFAFDVLFNKETTDSKAKYFKDTGSLTELLEHLDLTELSSLAKEMKSISRVKYTWRGIAEKYLYLFRMLDTNSIKNIGVKKIIWDMPEIKLKPENSDIDPEEATSSASNPAVKHSRL